MMKIQRILGQLLFAAGIMVGIAGSAQMPSAGQRYPDSLPVALAGMAVGILGLVLWHLALRADRSRQRSKQETGAKRNEPGALALLEALVAPAKEFKALAQTLDAKQIAAQADGLLERFVLPFGDKRSEIFDRFGMSKGAEILVAVAYGERMLNRVWSAAADGHLEEARACVPEAVDAFFEASRSLQDNP